MHEGSYGRDKQDVWNAVRLLVLDSTDFGCWDWLSFWIETMFCSAGSSGNRPFLPPRQLCSGQLFWQGLGHRPIVLGSKK